MALTAKPEPRGDVRIVFAQDGTITRYPLWDAPSPADERHRPQQLRRAVADLACAGVDVLAQRVFSAAGVAFFRPEHPDHVHYPYPIDPPQEEGVEAIDILIDECHKRGMRFVAKFRMSDRHLRSARGFITTHSEWWLKGKDFGADRCGFDFSKDFGADRCAFDFTYEEVRNWYAGLMEEIVRRFDVDGLELNFIRHEHCFPAATARERCPIMTGFLRRIREILDAGSTNRGRKLWLGVRVPQTLEECLGLGYDVPTWIKAGLIDYVAPCDFFYSDFNARYEEFAELTRSSDCMLFPAIHPVLCETDDVGLMRPENYRAIARNMYAAGADGLSTFNYMYHWSCRGGFVYPGSHAGYPLALAWLRELRDPERLAEGPRHYLFYPLSGASPVAATGFPKNDHILLKRQVGSSGTYRFRIAENLNQPGVISEIFVTARNMTPEDKVQFSINGTFVPASTIKSVWNQDGRPESLGRPLGPHMSFMWRFNCPPATFGDNTLGAELTGLAPEPTEDIIIDEIEFEVVPLQLSPERMKEAP